MRERGGSEGSCILPLTSLSFPLPTWFRPVLYYLNDCHWAGAGVHMPLLSVFREGLRPYFVEKNVFPNRSPVGPIRCHEHFLSMFSLLPACEAVSTPFTDEDWGEAEGLAQLTVSSAGLFPCRDRTHPVCPSRTQHHNLEHPC